MKQELVIDGLPPPGTPLEAAIDDQNKKLLDEELQERLVRINSKLPRPMLRRAQRRLRTLKRKLARVGWNALILSRQKLWDELLSLKVQALQADDQDMPAIRQHAREIRTAGNATNEKIARYQALADEYADISTRLHAHADAIRAEREEEENRQAFIREADVWEAQIRSVFRQSPRLHHLWQDKDGKTNVETPVIEHRHILTDRIMYQVQTSAQSVIERMMSRWHSALPYGVDVADLICEETLQNLSAACNRVVSVERNKKGTGFYYVVNRLDSPDGIPERVLYNRVLDWYPADHHAKTPWFAGMSANRKVETFNFEEYPHMLIGGATKGGKSNFINQMIATLVTLNSPDEIRLVLVDLKGGVEFVHWTELKHNLLPIAKRPEDVATSLGNVRSILDQRLAIFEGTRVKNLASYNALKPKTERLPRIIVVIDEMATLMEQDAIKATVDKQLNVISSQGRAVGIHLVVCTQRPSADVIMGWMKTNATMLVSAKMPHHTASLIILGTITAATLPSIPGRMVFSRGRDEIICQTPYITDEEIARAVAISNEYPDPAYSVATAVTAKPEIPRFGRDEVIQFALDNLDGKLSPTRIAEMVSDEIATEHQIRKLISMITEEGVDSVVEHCGQFYRLRKRGKTFILLPIADSPAHENGMNEPSFVAAIAADDPIASDESEV
jgi:hypothetical protein